MEYKLRDTKASSFLIAFSIFEGERFFPPAVIIKCFFLSFFKKIKKN